MPGTRLTLALTPGDPLGVGPEVCMRAAAAFRMEGVRLVLYGADAAWAQLPREGPWERVILPEPALVRPAQRCPSAWGGRIAMEALEHAVRDAINGTVDAVVTGPVSKQSMHLAGWSYPGQTEMLAALTGATDWAMMLAHGRYRVVLATRHLPLRDVPSALASSDLPRLFLLVDRELAAFLGRRPRMAVCGLNPHAGERGLLGHEEQTVVRPAIEEAIRRGCDAHGPVSAEEAFLRWKEFDVVVAMYHDQGALPVKLLGLDTTVNVTLGLPIVRTSPGHGTAFSLAGTGAARPQSVAAALRWAVALARRRER